jgi:MFS transporter, FLVCR family, MFS-domain-containing protein 7
VVSPFAYWTLNKYGPKLSIVAAAGLLLIGNWIRYGGVRASPPSYGAVMVGQVIIGFSQPFVLSAPTKYSELWFSTKGRISATAIATLANPLGAAIGSLVDPFLTVNPEDVGPMTLYVSIITTAVCIPAIFIPSIPPTPVAPTSVIDRPTIPQQLRLLLTSVSFWLMYFPFVVFVGFFNSFSTLLTQILTPYQFSENDSGIAGAILIVVGLVSAAITSPIVDKTKKYLLFLKILITILGLSYLVFIWAPPSRGDAYPYVICAIMGASSLSLVPVALEWLCEVTYPVGPELSSVLCWTGGQLFAAIFIIIFEALEDGPDGNPPYNMQRGLIFQAVLALVAVLPALLLGVVGKSKMVRSDTEKMVRETTNESALTGTTV